MAKKRKAPVPGAAARRVAIEAMERIDAGGAYANLVVPELLRRSDLAAEDRRFVTELAYGSTRMRRACDHLVDRFLLDEVEGHVRAALRIGAYQLAFLQTPPHAAVDATVGAVRGRGRSVVNAVLRRVAEAPVVYPDRATELSYPDWIIDRLTTDLGPGDADSALQAMNQAAQTSTRDDGYVQDPASQLVVDAVGAVAGDVVLDLCAAPGGKATGLANTGATVVAGELRRNRVRLTAENLKRLESPVSLLVADAAHPPLRPHCADHVLIDAPCSGLGSLRRRADARWRIDAAAPERLGRLQAELAISSLELLKPGGVLTYSVCTLTSAEGRDVLDRVLAEPGVSLVEPPPGPWLNTDGLSLLLPAETDGMLLFRVRRSRALPSRRS